MRILFFGTPDIAVPFLAWLHENQTVVGVVCQADKPVGRGYDIQPTPCKVFAREKNIPVFQPEGLWEEPTLNQLRKTEADIGIAVAYGRILPESVFKLPKHGTLNVHFSLLPKNRGAAPIQWALIRGEKETGVTIFWLEKGLDTGPVFHQFKLPIESSDDALTMEPKLIKLGMEAMAKTIADISDGKMIQLPQLGDVSLAPILRKEIGVIDWTKPSADIVNLVRGLCRWPGTVTTYVSSDEETKKFKILKAMVRKSSREKIDPGIIMGASQADGIVVRTGDGEISLLQIQPEGKKSMTAWAFWQGAHLKIGETFK